LSATSAACRKLASDAGLPESAASASGLRQGLWATPPSTTRGGHRDEREGVRGAVADLQVIGVLREGGLRQLYGHDEFAVLEVGVLLRRVARQAVELADGDRALTPARAPDPHDGIERVERVRHVARIGGDTLLAPAEDGVHPVEPSERPAARPRLPLVARHRRVVEILAARALQEVPAVGRHVAELRGGARDNGLGEERAVVAYEQVVGGVRVRRQGADGDAAARRSDLGELQAGQVDQLVGTLDVLFHQIEDVGPAGQELRLRVRRVGRRTQRGERFLMFQEHEGK
jgi:hypothetical protein